MKPSTSFKITLATLLAAGFLGTSVLPVLALSRFSQARESSSGSQGILVAGRLGFRLRVRPSRFRVGGFARGSCPPVTIAPVTPPTRPEETASDKEAPVDSTASAHPTLFVNIPAEMPGATAQLTLQNEAAEQELYSTKFALTGKPGIVGIRIPESVPPLQVGQKYLWQVSVVCNANKPQERLFTMSWVERVALDPTVASQINQASLREKSALYAEAGIWQDTLSSLAELRLSNPNDQSVAQDWASLMQSVNLQDFANKPVVQIAGR